MSVVRPLPARPSLEYERKEAKALLRRLRAGDPDATARARAHHPTFDERVPERARLADAQLVVAREYGFASWPRLVRWFGDVARHELGLHQIHGGHAMLDARVRELLAEHRARRPSAARVLAAFVPRFYGMPADDVLAAPIFDDDARLAVARSHCAPSWEVALERAAWSERRVDPWSDPMREVFAAMADADLPALERIVAQHSDLLHPVHQEISRGRSLIAMAVDQERRRGREAMRPIIEWLEARGFDRQRELNSQLCGYRLRPSADDIQALIEQGADPNGVAPNGVPVLEHALLRYWNGDAVDVVAARAAPRDALWIAAGLGDVDGVRRFLDGRGRPTMAARRLRPDFAAVGLPIPSLPDPDDEELLFEVLVVATLNGRVAVLEELVARGAPINSLVLGMPLINLAVGNGMVSAVECLVRCRADLELRGRSRDETARELARLLFEQMPSNADRRRIVELCGMDPDAILAERDARPVPPPTRLPMFDDALALAGDDAARLGQPEVQPESLLFGLLRAHDGPRDFLAHARLDLARFRADLADRLRPADERVAPRDLPLSADAQAVVDAATSLAATRRQDVVHLFHLLLALTHPADGTVARLLTSYGADVAVLRTELEKAL